ncbi:hypothetical protein [Paraburkholderia susongensis]|uniref:hypothetical protein n=1 Tax=Paraburkholderia susongensis TaxID=1515439 RepID=UPI0011816DA7|nr:hypothetical protein [Paraburkholderia susongensis]
MRGGFDEQREDPYARVDDYPVLRSASGTTLLSFLTRRYHDPKVIVFYDDRPCRPRRANVAAWYSIESGKRLVYAWHALLLPLQKRCFFAMSFMFVWNAWLNTCVDRMTLSCLQYGIDLNSGCNGASKSPRVIVLIYVIKIKKVGIRDWRRAAQGGQMEYSLNEPLATSRRPPEAYARFSCNAYEFTFTFTFAVDMLSW